MRYPTGSNPPDRTEYQGHQDSDDDDDDLYEEGTDKSADRDNGHSSDRTDITMTEDTDLLGRGCTGRAVRRNRDGAELDEFG